MSTGSFDVLWRRGEGNLDWNSHCLSILHSLAPEVLTQQIIFLAGCQLGVQLNCVSA